MRQQNRLARWWRHLWCCDATVRRYFDADALAAIEAAIAQGETLHAAEVRMVIEPSLDMALLRDRIDARTRARALFAELRIWDTEHNNGVMLYVLLADRAFEIVADRAAARSVPDSRWQRICDQMAACYAQRDVLGGTLAAIEAIHAELAPSFPVGERNPDELPNRPLMLG